jgi:ABC-2 type transport system permease protein
MAVFEQKYKPYVDELTPNWSRFFVIPRYAYKEIFQSRIFLALFVSCFVYPLACMLIVYLHHNATALEMLRLPITQVIPIDLDFFYYFVVVQSTFGFFVTMFIGPTLVAKDVSNNALALYLCRPFSRNDYVLGKMVTLLILLSLITWVPGILLFFFQCYLEGTTWMFENIRILFAIFVGSSIWIILLALMSQAISAWVKWRVAAMGILLGLFFIPNAIALVIRGIFDTKWGYIISTRSLMRTILADLFKHSTRIEVPVWSAWVAVSVICVFCLFLLFRKVKACEVIS